MLHLLESDVKCSRSTKYASKLVKNFLDEPFEKNRDFEIVCIPPHDDFIRGIFLHNGSFKCGCWEYFL